METDQVRPARRDQPRRRRHARPVHHRPLRADSWTGATSARWRSIPRPRRCRTRSGAAIMPGSKKVVDRATGKLVACDATTCPYAIDGVNHAPFAAFGGWSGAINAAKDAEGQGRGLRLPVLHERSRSSRTSTSPSARPASTPTAPRSSTDQDLWIKAGMSEDGGQELSRRHQGQPEQPEHGARPARAAEPALSADRARHGGAPLPGRRDHSRTRPIKADRRPAGTRSPTSSAGTTSSPPTSRLGVKRRRD